MIDDSEITDAEVVEAEVQPAGTDGAAEMIEIEVSAVEVEIESAPGVEPPEEEPARLVLDGEPAPDGDTHIVRIEDTVEALPAIARVAAGVWLRAAAWGVGTSLRVGVRLARAATDPVAAVDLYEGLTDGMRAYAREFLGISDLDERVQQLTPLAGATMRQNGTRAEDDLRARGEELLRQAADVGFDETAHPAYARILTELAPDEARILRVLANEGPQPMVDVRAQNLIGLGSQLVAPGLNMLGAQAGLRRRERVPAYMNNLVRLGLVELSDEEVDDPIAYQVLEAQPEVLSKIKDTARAKTVHRSVRLTAFGEDFCAVCLPRGPASAHADSPPLQLPGGGGAENH